MKNYIPILLAMALAGCADINKDLNTVHQSLMSANLAMAGVSVDSFSAAIVDYEKLHPLTTNLCVPLEGFNYATGKIIFQKGVYDIEEKESRWDSLVGHGLFQKNVDHGNLIYRMTALGRGKFSDVLCAVKPSPFSMEVRSGLLYGKVGFDRFVDIKQNQVYRDHYHVVYLQHFVKLDDWAKDVELRRKWNLPGIAEVTTAQWEVDLVRNSNGVRVENNPYVH